MTDREKMLHLLDEFKDTIVKLIDERDSLKGEGEELRTSKREAEEKAWAVEEKVKELTTESEKANLAKDKTAKKLATAKEELEAIRLVDLEGMDQQEAALNMGVSRKTLWNDLKSGRKKVAMALINGYAIRIEGGSYILRGEIR